MGKLIVLEGIDGTGKSTQFELLQKYLTSRGVSYRALTYPDYQDESSTLVRMYLGGAFGSDPDSVNAYAAGTFYAVDRFASYARYWKEDYERGTLCLACRYTTSNAVHQGAKMEPGEREAYYEWLSDFEYNKIGIPAPDRVFLLDLPAEVALANVRSRAQSMDIHETDTEYLRRSAESARAAAKFYGWIVIPCCDAAGRMYTREEISAALEREIAELI